MNGESNGWRGFSLGEKSLFLCSFFFCFSFLEGALQVGKIDDREVDQQKRYCHKHIEIVEGDDLTEEKEQGVFGHEGVHIVDVNDLTRPVNDIVDGAVLVDCQINEMYHGIDAEGDADGGGNASVILLHDTEAEEKDGNACLQNVGEEVKKEGPGKDLVVSLCGVDQNGEEGAEAPDDEKVTENTASRQDGDG